MKKKLLFVLCCVLALSSQVLAQEIQVTGTVISGEDDTGLPGVNVIVKGTTVGTVSDINGAYSLQVPDDNSILVFSSVGYVSQEITVGTNTVIDVTLFQDVTALSEIVVVSSKRSLSNIEVLQSSVLSNHILLIFFYSILTGY